MPSSTEHLPLEPNDRRREVTRILARGVIRLFEQRQLSDFAMSKNAGGFR
ncbi:MAG: hypothetical protein V3T70_09970 [Phycisphaerae bacterium]